MRRRHLQLLFAEGTIKRSLHPSGYRDERQDEGEGPLISEGHLSLCPCHRVTRKLLAPIISHSRGSLFLSCSINGAVYFLPRTLALSSPAEEDLRDARDPRRIEMYTEILIRAQEMRVLSTRKLLHNFFYFSHFN